VRSLAALRPESIIFGHGPSIGGVGAAELAARGDGLTA
jgi:hypothetical protein